MNAVPKPDIKGRVEIEQLVNRFYERIREDDVLGFIFNDIAQVDWRTHLPRMYAFWETVLFRSGGYTGNPLAAHAKLTLQTEMGRPQFDRWLSLFRSTVDELFAGEHAEHIKNCAADMASVIHGRINHIPDPRTSPDNLTAEQRERYRAYREKAAV
jgi:hemoglobin